MLSTNHEQFQTFQSFFQIFYGGRFHFLVFMVRKNSCNTRKHFYLIRREGGGGVMVMVVVVVKMRYFREGGGVREQWWPKVDCLLL